MNTLAQKPGRGNTVDLFGPKLEGILARNPSVDRSVVAAFVVEFRKMAPQARRDYAAEGRRAILRHFAKRGHQPKHAPIAPRTRARSSRRPARVASSTRPTATSAGGDSGDGEPGDPTDVIGNDVDLSVVDLFDEWDRVTWPTDGDEEVRDV